jgi:hypothetical protein
MIGTHLGGRREEDPLEAWRALAAAVVLQAVREALEQPARCQGRPRKWCNRRGCSRCATEFLNSEEGLALLSLLLGYRCTPKHVHAFLTCPTPVPDKSNKAKASDPEKLF